MAPITMPVEATDSPIVAQCADSAVLNEIASTATDPKIVVAGTTIVATGEMVLVKTMRGEEETSMVETPSSEFNQAIRTTVTKNFVGGLLFADLDTSGAFDEPDERRLLYSDCGVGTSPGDVRGHWRGIHINESSQVFVDGVGAVTDADPPVAITTDVNTYKVCVKLDAHPGVTKCYVNVMGGQNAGAQIALYNEDGTLTTLKDNDALVGDGGSLSTGNATGILFATTGGTGDLGSVNEICEIFADGTP